jgi:steroid delta-isomerase
MPTEHPARRAGLLSQKHASERNREAWLALFAEDAVLEDPVGSSPLDAAGKGHAGKAAIAAFYDTYIGAGRVSFDYPRSFACGNECAFIGSVYNKLPGRDAETRADGVFVYRVDEEGKLVSLRAFWEWERPVLATDLHPPVGRGR